MSHPTVSPGDMPTPPLDPDTADRLLAGSIHPDDAPAGYRRVAALIATAREPVTEAERVEPPAGLGELVTSSPPATAPTGGRRRRLATVAVAATVLLGASGSAAATNSLPAPVQRTVSSLGSHLGLSIPTPTGPAEPTPPTDPGTDGEGEPPSVTEPDETIDERSPDPGDPLPIDPGPDVIDEVVPDPTVATPTQPAPVDPPLTSNPCAPDEVLTNTGDCVPFEEPQLDTTTVPDLTVEPTPTTTTLPEAPDHPGEVGGLGDQDLLDPALP